MIFKHLTIYIVSVIFLLSNAVSQESEKVNKPDDDLTYKILPRFPVNVSNKYVYNEKSKIKRVFSTGNSLDFERDLIYHYSLISTTPADKQGFQLMDVSVDSINYKFKNKDTTYIYNDQADDMRPPKIDDYQIKLVPLGMNFQMTYSPYFNVAKVGGDMLMEKRNYLTAEATAPSDDLLKHTWLAGLKDESLIATFDVLKGFPPMEKVVIDSIWTVQVLSELEGCKFIDTVEFKLTNFNIQNFTIKGVSKGKSAIPELVRVFGLSHTVEFVDIDNNQVEYTIKMHPRGSVSLFEIKYITDLKYKTPSDFLIQKVETTKTWTLEKMYNW